MICVGQRQVTLFERGQSRVKIARGLADNTIGQFRLGDYIVYLGFDCRRVDVQYRADHQRDTFRQSQLFH